MGCSNKAHTQGVAVAFAWTDKFEGSHGLWDAQTSSHLGTMPLSGRFLAPMVKR